MGVDDFKGLPHYFESEWNNLNDYELTEIFRLSPVSKELLELTKESWSIWKRWEDAFHKERVDQSSHPYLPEVKINGKKIDKEIEGKLKLDDSNFFKMPAEF